MISVTVATTEDAADWAAMRQALWPKSNPGQHDADIARLLAVSGDTINFIARADDHRPIGFAEAGLRHDYVNGTESSPVAFLEGIYVEPAFRRTGVARQLVEAVEDWARQQGCSELASDTGITNIASQTLHNALGFTETQRVVYFRKVLD
ncbi:MAG: aminoglycoside 6'-N-acetyltransferase [Devosia sp.]